MEKYKADGSSGTTYGLADDGTYTIQIQYPDDSFGSPQEMDKEGHWGWDWWMNKYDPTEIENFPDEVTLG